MNEIELYLKLCVHVYLQKLAVLYYFRSLFSLARRASSWSAVILFFGDSSIETVSLKYFELNSFGNYNFRHPITLTSGLRIRRW